MQRVFWLVFRYNISKLRLFRKQELIQFFSQFCFDGMANLKSEEPVKIETRCNKWPIKTTHEWLSPRVTHHLITGSITLYWIEQEFKALHFKRTTPDQSRTELSHQDPNQVFQRGFKIWLLSEVRALWRDLTRLFRVFSCLPAISAEWRSYVVSV